MKITGLKIESFLRDPDPAVRAVLVYGSDIGLVHERAIQLAQFIVSDLQDPFRCIAIFSNDLKKDPARLFDEAAAIAFTSGRRLIRIPDGNDGIAKTFKTFLYNPVGDAFIILEAGMLSPRSKLRKVFETAKNAAIIACYEDNNLHLSEVIHDTLSRNKLTASLEATTYLEQNLGSDRMVTRKELEKLALFKGAPGEVSLNDARVCIGDNGSSSLDSIIYTAAGGDLIGLDVALARVLNEGLHPIAILRGMARHLQRLHLASGTIDAGMSTDQAMKALKPPINFRFTNSFRQQLQRWSKNNLAQAIQLLTEAEIDCKRTSMPAEAICGRALLRVAQAGRK